MKLLLDTHVLLWWLLDDPALPDEVQDHLDHHPDVYLSVASVWEIAIKQAAGKLPHPSDLMDHVLRCGFRELLITSEHAITAGRLPSIHRDPFDRMLIAQAHCEGLTLVTRDETIRKYDVPVLLA